MTSDHWGMPPIPDTTYIPEDPAQWGPIDANALREWAETHAPENVRRAVCGLLDNARTKKVDALLTKALDVAGDKFVEVDLAAERITKALPPSIAWAMERDRLLWLTKPRTVKEKASRAMLVSAHNEKAPRAPDSPASIIRFMEALVEQLPKITKATGALDTALADITRERP